MSIFKDIIRVFDDDFEESEHPRDKGGKFAVKSGSGESTKGSSPHSIIKEQSEVKMYNKLPSKIKQIYDKKLKSEKKATNDMKNISKAIGMDLIGLDFRVKQPKSAVDKIRRTAEKYAYKNVSKIIDDLYDVVRYTMTSHSDDMVKKSNSAIEKLKSQGYEVVELKNTWIDKRDDGYLGVNLKLKNKNGDKFELQFHTPESFERKNGERHILYERMRRKNISTNEMSHLTRKLQKLLKEEKQIEVPKDIDRLYSVISKIKDSMYRLNKKYYNKLGGANSNG